MASFPFDPTPFIPEGHQSIVVEGRVARVRVAARAVAPMHEEWVIVSIVPMPNLSIPFANVREVITKFLTDIKRKGFSEIIPCPFGQAYVKLNSVFDRDEPIQQGPHLYIDVHLIFQKHNEGLNWRRFVLDHEVRLSYADFRLTEGACMNLLMLLGVSVL